jgi:hypothetical protein
MLREQSRDIGRRAESIPGVSPNSIRQIIDNLRFASLELRRVGVDFSHQFNARFKRIKFEDDLNAARGNIQKSNRLFEADRYMRRNPGRYETATQRISAVDRLKELTHPFAAKMGRYREIYGGDAELIQKAEADEAYRKHIKAVRDPVGVRRDALREKFGGGARGNILAINAMRAEADEAYRKDMLSVFDSRMEDLTERYGGDRNKAEEKYKKELSQNLPLFFRNSKMTAKQMFSISKGLSVGRAIATPVGMAAGVAVQTINKIVSGADDANKRSVGIENLKNLYGGLSKNETNAALLAGMTPEQALQAKGKLMMKYGPRPFEVLRGIATQVKDASPQARTALAEKLGIDESLFAMVDILGRTGRIGVGSGHRQTQAKLENEKIRGMYLRRSGSGFLNTIKGMSSDSWAARSSEAIKISNESSGVPNQTLVTPSEKSSSSGNQVSINIGTVDVNADNPEQFAYGLASATSSHSNNHTLAVAFDSGLKA